MERARTGHTDRNISNKIKEHHMDKTDRLFAQNWIGQLKEQHAYRPHPSVGDIPIRYINNRFERVFIEACMEPSVYGDIWRDRQYALLRTPRAYLIV